MAHTEFGKDMTALAPEWELIFGDLHSKREVGLCCSCNGARCRGRWRSAADTETSAGFRRHVRLDQGPEGLDAASGGIGAAAALASGAPLTALFAGGSKVVSTYFAQGDTLVERTPGRVSSHPD